MKKADIFGLALHDYYNKEYTEDIVVHSSIASDDIIPLDYLFRTFDHMPVIEQKALQLAKGKTLDIGCCAGSHLLWLTRQGIQAEGLDISKGAAALSRKRTAATVYHSPILKHSGMYDTLLLLMNGTGIFENTLKIDTYLQHLKSLLTTRGQLLIDSSDIKYMFEDEDGGFWVDTHREYYGEVTYSLSYKGYKSASFDWLYMDYEMLAWYAKKNELHAELILEGTHYEYLARLTVAS